MNRKMLLFAAIPSIYLHRDAHYLAKRKVYIFNLMIPLCGSWAGFGEILIWGFLGVSFCKYYSFNKTSRRGVPAELRDYDSLCKLHFGPRHFDWR